MFHDDLAYFRQRAEEERERAADARLQSVIDIHLALAAKYDSLAQTTQGRWALDSELGARSA